MTGVSFASILIVPEKDVCAALLPPSGTSAVKALPNPSSSPGTVTTPRSVPVGAGPLRCQNWAVPSISQVPLSSTSVTRVVSVSAGTSTTRAPLCPGSVLTGVVAVTTFSVAVKRAKLFLVRSRVWIVPSLMP